MTSDLEEALLARCEKRGDCLVWIGPINEGYGQMWWNRAILKERE